MWALDLAWSIEFRNGLQWPLRSGDTLRAYGPDHQELGAIPASVLLDLLRHAILMARLQHRLGAAFDGGTPRPVASVRDDICSEAWRVRQRAVRRARPPRR